ncbi:ArsR/SmtB family transcription factor [Rhodovulum sp. DZ06]|uniref:ArsR/SmtB family transcription factor n=1 Tax=Rhodovulum sp. DZ06 TaxID=3425126 RepID=UPI003D325B52
MSAVTSIEDDALPSADEMEALAGSAVEASAFLKAMAHDGRLMILCLLMGRERTVGELESLVPFRQAAVSQQLARLRLEGMVEAERDGKHLRYRLADKRVERLVGVLHELFCPPES